MMHWKFLPTLCTVMNLAAGACSLLMTIQGHYGFAFLLILSAALFDVLDGLLARLLNSTSEFGKQLDSLADLISFGAAPAFLVLLGQLNVAHSAAPIAAILFIVCGALRLARFNTSGTNQGFTGMPITAAGSLLALISLTGDTMQPAIIVILILILAWLMISRIPFPSFKNILVRK